jgi:hypothetical protein
MAKRKFKPEVDSFYEVTVKLRQIGKYLDNLNRSLKRLKWTELKKKKRPKNDGGGGGDPGSKPPGGWPP